MNSESFMRVALELARHAYGMTSPNPMVGAVVVKNGRIIGKGWHRRAGGPHAEIEALNDARRRGRNVRGATVYVTLEPCSTHGRTPPCTDAILAAGVRKVIAGATDPNPRHAGAGFKLLRKSGIQVTAGVLEEQCTSLNEPFNHWIVHRTPHVTVKAAMTLDGKIATANGESKWITGEDARAYGMRLRYGADAILVGVNTIVADDPRLTIRAIQSPTSFVKNTTEVAKFEAQGQELDKFQISNSKSEIPRRRIVLDTEARTPLSARVLNDEWKDLTMIVVGPRAPASRVKALTKSVRVLKAPARDGRIDVNWLMKRLGEDEVMSLLVEGGGEVNASFLFGGHAHRVAFFYAPKVLGGRNSKKAVAGNGAEKAQQMLDLEDVEWGRAGDDLILTGRIK